MVGRPAKPAATKKAEGTYRKDRDKELPVQVAIPDPPDWLGSEERKYWRRIAEGLAAQGTIGLVDDIALSMFCSVIVEFREADDDVKAKGMTGETDTGYEYQRPCVGIRAKAWSRLLAMCRQFGMTPSARASILKKANEPEDDGIDEERRQAEEAARKGRR
jgi:P27 family predicted phage terminase small subunit